MTFKPEELANFFTMFEQKKQAIRNFPGCHHLEVWQEKEQPHIVFTYSFWDNTDALNSYRRSDLFKSTWAETKAKFAGKPTAHTVELYQIVRP